METTIVRPGIWSDLTGMRFEVIGVATGRSLDDEVVVYRGVRSGKLFYRPVENFLGEVEVDAEGTLVPRFTWVTYSNQK